MSALLLVLAAAVGDGPVTLTVDPSRTFQTIDGFGGFGGRSVFWEPGPYHDDAFLRTLVDDLGASIVRTQIYWDGEPENDDPDPRHLAWGKFDFGPKTYNGRQFPYLKALKQRGLSKLVATVFTPPLWMKQGVQNELAVFCEGQCGGRLDPLRREEFAEYLIAYVQTLRRETGIELYALSIQNEMLFANPFESCVYTPKAYADTLKVVSERFEQAGLQTRFFGPEHMGEFDWNRDSGLFAALLEDARVRPHLDIYAVHGYLDGFAPDLGSAEGWQRFARKAASHRIPLWMTETSDDQRSGWERAWAMATGLHLALAHGNVKAWLHFQFSEGRIVVDAKLTELGRAYKAWFRYIRPGATRVAVDTDRPALQATAFVRKDEVVTVVVNTASTAVSARLVVGTQAVRSLALYQADAHGSRETASAGALVSLPPRSVSTLRTPLPPPPLPRPPVDPI